jgi:hypothetical protein
MVNWVRFHILALGITASCAISTAAKDLADYRIGDRVEEDIITPVELKVVDVEATTALKEKEASRVLVILRHDPSVLTDVEGNLRDAFNTTRSNFMRSVESQFKNRKLDEAALASSEFEIVRTTFQRTNKSFPVSTNLAAVWASGDTGRVEQAVVIDRLREIMRQPIRDPKAPARIKVTTRARLVSVTDRDEELTPDAVTKRGKTVQRTNAIALDRARRDLLAMFPPEEAATGKFVASLLQPNSRLEEELTEKMRGERTEALWVLDEYRANEVVARNGQIVDAKILGALRAVQEKLAEARLKETMALAATRTRETRAAREQIKWLALGAGVVTLGLGLVTWQWWRRRREASLLPVLAGDGSLTAASPEAAAWQHRALEAERRVEQAHEAIRAGVLTQVTEVLKENLVHNLITQRKELIEAQQAAALELEALEKRLDEIHAPLQERLRAYEARIAELEKALAAKDEQNRELIKAKIALVRQQLEAERAKNQAVMN